MAKEKNTGSSEAAPLNLAELTDEQLVELAAEKGVELKPGWDRDVIIEVISESLKTDPPADDQDQNGDQDSKPDSEKDNAVTPVKEGDDTPVGTIREINGVESVNVGAAWVPTIREKIEEGKPVTIISNKRAGRTIFGKTGKPITFDENGRATASAADGQYLLSIAVDGVPEFTVE